jgi:hypothetical protein
MTCIVGLVEDGVIYMAADSASPGCDSGRVELNPKVSRKGEFVIGVQASNRAAQLLAYSFEPPHPFGEHVTPLEFMCRDFVDALHKCLTDKTEHVGVFLVGYAGRLFKIDYDYSVQQSADGYDAVGAGDREALGALFVTDGVGAKQRLRLALLAAQHLTTSVREPFDYETLGLVAEDAAA